MFSMAQVIPNTLVLKYSKIWLVVLRICWIYWLLVDRQILWVLFYCWGRAGDFCSQERAACVVFPTEASSPIPEISASQGTEDGTHCLALLQGSATAEEMDPLIRDK